MRSSTKIKTFIDLFCGIGGIRIPFDELGLQCVFSSDNDKTCQLVYNDNFREIPTGDITKVNENLIPDFDLLLAGFPCQPFSYSGKLKGFEDSTRGTLFFDIIRIMKQKRPKMFLLENVKGLKSHDNGRTVEIIIKTLESLGYTIYSTVLNSHDFGVPQKRERWYCVGFDKKIQYSFPSGSNPHTKLKDIVDLELKDKRLELSKFEIERIQYHFAHTEKRVQHDNSKYAPNTKKGKYGVYSYLKPDNTLRFHVGDASKTQIQEAYYVSLESVAPAIIATREPKLWDIGRRLSLDECRKLQGFPDNFIFNVSDRVGKKQLGNAVAVPVIRAIANSMLTSYNNPIQLIA